MHTHDAMKMEKKDKLDNSMLSSFFESYMDDESVIEATIEDSKGSSNESNSPKFYQSSA